VSPLAPLVPLLPLVSPLVPLLPLVSPLVPLAPLLPLVSPLVPLAPLLPLVSPLVPLVPLLPLGSPLDPVDPLVVVPLEPPGRVPLEPEGRPFVDTGFIVVSRVLLPALCVQRPRPAVSITRLTSGFSIASASFARPAAVSRHKPRDIFVVWAAPMIWLAYENNVASLALGARSTNCSAAAAQRGRACESGQ
ncbi:MAG: hypothetical protein ABL879_02695, partial [Devosia sp.]